MSNRLVAKDLFLSEEDTMEALYLSQSSQDSTCALELQPSGGNFLPPSSVPIPPTNWLKCFLCQSDKSENLRDPMRNPRANDEMPYKSLAEKLLEFDKIGKVPFKIDVKKLNEGPGLLTTLITNKALYHHSCYANCSSSRLKREQEKDSKRQKRSLFENEENKENAHTPSPVKLPRCDPAIAHDRALQHVLQFMNDSRSSLKDSAPVFYLPDISNKYSEKMKEMGFQYDVHTTRLKDRLLAANPSLEAAGSQGKEIIITFKNDVDSVIRRLSSNDFQGLSVDPSVAIAAGVIREDIFAQEKYDWQDISKEAQYSCVPKSLRLLLKILLNGPTPETDIDVFDPIVNSLSQIIRYHTVKRKRASERTRRHDRSKECPVPVYMGLKLYAETRQKKMVENAHKMGVSISYDRVQDIIIDIANRNAAHYEAQGVVCPPSMKKNVFTTAAADNFDHNTSSTTAAGSFHGTAISLLQHPTTTQTEPSWQPLPSVSTGKTVTPLPKDFSDVQPCFLNPKDAKFASPPIGEVERCCSESPFQQELEWLESVAVGGSGAVNWSTHHGAQERGRVRVITPAAILPLFKEHASTARMMLHAMKVARAAIFFLNPSQTAVLTVDQPLYAICRALQLLLDADLELGEKNLMIMMGGLHIEMCILRCLGQWAEGSGWTKLLTEARILTEGRAESVLKGSHVTRTRYAHEKIYP
ncbi:hypothetical protein FOCC_FOCC015593 [Frankliniella occidentalis]|nr:hypothetical protein FOCC_FOCC015593 [Frankliniella occidentalis]